MSGLAQPTASCLNLFGIAAVLVVAVSRPFRSASAVSASVHSAPPPPRNRRRLAWRARSGTGPTLIGSGHGSCFGETEAHGHAEVICRAARPHARLAPTRYPPNRG